MANLKEVYGAADEQTARDALDAFAQCWDRKNPKISQSRRENRPNLTTCFKYPQEVRRLIHIIMSVPLKGQDGTRICLAFWLIRESRFPTR